MGADDYLTKPFDRRDLIEVIDTHLTMKIRVENIYNQAIADLQNRLLKTLPHEFRTPLLQLLMLLKLCDPMLIKCQLKIFRSLVISYYLHLNE